MDQELVSATALKNAEVYEQFLVPGIFRFWTPQLIKRADPKKDEKVLDVACGTGVVARAIVPLVGTMGKVVGLDMNPAMLEVACRQYSEYCEDIDWQEGMAERIPFNERSFDLVTCQQGLQFFKDKPKALREFHRVLQPKGRVTIAVWQSIEHNPFYQKVFDTIANEFEVEMKSLSAPFIYRDPDELEKPLKAAGFHNIKVDSIRQDVHFKDLDHFVELTIRAAGAVMPAFAQIADGVHYEKLDSANRKVADLLVDHSINGELVFPMYSYLATADA